MLMTFETGTEVERLEIHAHLADLKKFAQSLIALADAVEKSGPDHLHLTPEAWGGSSLSTIPQGVEAKCFDHVKVFCWSS
jgi:hypothetical protein